MKRSLATIVLLAMAMLYGCASMPSAAKIESADYGTPISRDAAIALVTGYEKSRAKDPYSLVVECDNFQRGWTQNKITSSSFVAGYMLDCGINGKNSFGAYVGVRNYRFVIHDGEVVRAMEQMSNGAYGPASMVDGMRNSGIY